MLVAAAAWKAHGPKGSAVSLTDCVASFASSDKPPTESVTVYVTTLKANKLLWIPPGYLIAERCTRGPVIYGVRKSVCTPTPSAKTALEAVADMMDKESRSTQRLREVIALIQ